MKSILILSIFIKSETFIYWISSDESWIYTDLDTQYLFWQYSPFLNIHLLNIMMVIVNITEFVYYEYYSIHIHNIIIILIRIWLIYHEYVRIWVSIIICDDMTRIPCLPWTTSPQKVILHKPLRPRPGNLSQFCHRLIGNNCSSELFFQPRILQDVPCCVHFSSVPSF